MRSRLGDGLAGMVGMLGGTYVDIEYNCWAIEGPDEREDEEEVADGW